MKTFKSLAFEILREAGKPLHVSIITNQAIKKWLVTSWKTPQATMNAVLITDVNSFWVKSRFIKTSPATFALNQDVLSNWKAEINQSDDRIDVPISKVTTKQKWDIAEARIAELITLYWDTSMWCYKPISDDEWIDLIVKQKWSMKTMYLQIKSRFSHGIPKPFTATVKASGVLDQYSMWIVFCSFDYDEWDLRDYLRFVPAPDFLVSANKLQWWKSLWFVSGTSRRKENKRDKYLIDKRLLSQSISEIMWRM